MIAAAGLKPGKLPSLDHDRLSCRLAHALAEDNAESLARVAAAGLTVGELPSLDHGGGLRFGPLLLRLLAEAVLDEDLLDGIYT